MKKTALQKIMRDAWQLVKLDGLTISEALRLAWFNFKLRVKMAVEVVRFRFTKIDGSTREAIGTLHPDKMPPTKGTARKTPATVQIYYDVEKGAYRSYKLANLAIL